MGQSRPLYNLFFPFSQSNIKCSFNFNKTNWKSIDGVLGIWTLSIGKTTELWRLPPNWATLLPVKNWLFLSANFVRVFKTEGAARAVVRGQLGDGVHLLDGGEKVGHEVSGVNWRQLENAAEKHDLEKLTAFFEAWSSVVGWPRSWPTCSSGLITCWATDVGPFFLFLGLGSASIWIGNSARMSSSKGTLSHLLYVEGRVNNL